MSERSEDSALAPGGFTNYPVSIAEARADREDDCRSWTPRDALISLLRDLDSGKTRADALMCVYRERLPDGNTRTHFVNATPDIHTALGLLTAGHFKLLED